MGFPKRVSDTMMGFAYDGHKIVSTITAFVCPRCCTRATEIPTQCCVCGLQLNSSSHIARSHHHLFPVPLFHEVDRSKVTSWSWDSLCRMYGETSRRFSPASMSELSSSVLLGMWYFHTWFLTHVPGVWCSISPMIWSKYIFEYLTSLCIHLLQPQLMFSLSFFLTCYKVMHVIILNWSQLICWLESIVICSIYIVLKNDRYYRKVIAWRKQKLLCYDFFSTNLRGTNERYLWCRSRDKNTTTSTAS